MIDAISFFLTFVFFFVVIPLALHLGAAFIVMWWACGGEGEDAPKPKDKETEL